MPSNEDFGNFDGFDLDDVTERRSGRSFMDVLSEIERQESSAELDAEIEADLVDLLDK